MNRKFIFTLNAVFLVSLLNLQAQTAEKWNQNIDGQIIWQQVTSMGYLIVCSNEALMGLDSNTGQIKWSQRQYGSVPFAAFGEVPSSPLISVAKDDGLYFLEPVTGQVIFDSKKAGIGKVADSYLLYGQNGILVAEEKPPSGDPKMVMIDLSTGDIRWTLQEPFGRIVAAKEVSDDEVLVVTLFNNYKINSNNGSVIWKNTTSKEAAQADKLGAFGALLKNAAEEMAKDLEFDMYFYQHPSENTFYIASNQEGSSMGSSGAVLWSNVYYAYNIDDGELIWQDPLEINGKVGEVIFHQNGLIILPNDGNRSRLNIFDYATASGKWGKKGKGINIKGGVYDYVETDKGFLLVTTNGTNNYLNVLDANQGLLTFDKPAKINGSVVGTVNTAKGILYITTEEINILDPATGTFLLPKSVRTRPSLTAEDGNTIYAFDLKENVVKAIDKDAATVKVVSKTPLKFEGKEKPRSIELRENGIFVNSDQNVSLVSYDGSLVYQKYYQAPREPGWKRALMYAQAVRASYIGASSYYVAGALQSAAPEVGQDDAVAGAVVQGLGDAYEQLGNAAADYAKDAFNQASARFKATANGRDFMIILAKIDKGNALIKVNKDTGEIEGTIDLGKEKEPVYAVDDVTSQVYYNVEGSRVVSYVF